MTTQTRNALDKPLRRTASVMLAAVMLLLATMATSAHAAPELAVDITHVGDFAPGSDGRYVILPANVGDTNTSGTVTMTHTLPAGMTAVSAADTLPGFDAWTCSIPDGQTVSCQLALPAPFDTIEAGKDACLAAVLGSIPCPIAVDVQVSAGIGEGVFDSEASVCGGGAASCGTDVDPTRVLEAGAYGDRFGVAAINDHPLAIEEVPALPGQQHAFWAGMCDRIASDGFFGPLSPPGIGTRPAQILVPGSAQPHTLVTAPSTADHCIDWGFMSPYGTTGVGQADIWMKLPWVSPFTTLREAQIEPAGTYAPSWRLPAATQAGGHPDGTTMFALERGPRGGIDGGLDDVYVDLPPGVVGNPKAVPACSAEDFSAKPLLCPPESQVGVIRICMEGAPFNSATNVGSCNDFTYPLYNVEPRKGRIAELGFGYASSDSAVTVRLVAKARTNGDFGVTAFTGQVPASLPVIVQSATLWGVPWAAENDIWRTKLGHAENPPCIKQPESLDADHYIPPGGLQDLGTEDCRAHYNPSWGEIKPFLTNETDCNPAPTTRVAMDSYQHQGSMVEGLPDIAPFPQVEDELAPDGTADNPTTWETYASKSPAVTGCADLDFEPELNVEPTSKTADSPTGISAQVSTPQNNDLLFDLPAPDAPDAEVQKYVEDATNYWRSDDGLATAHLKDAVVTLPNGFSLNPSGAAGLEACSDSGIGVRGFDTQNGRPLFNDGDPFNKDGGADGAECPDESKIGTVNVDTPLLEEDLNGVLVLGEPKSTDPTSGEMFRLFVVAQAPERGLIAKIFGSATADPATGRLTTTFKNNPEVPFDTLTLETKPGARGMLATPPTCGDAGWTSSFAPWSGSAAVERTGAIAVDTNCAFAFAPAFSGGSSSAEARGKGGTLSLRFTRNDGDQTLEGLSVKLPKGLLADVGSVPLCRGTDAANGSCPATSRIGYVDGSAGAGTPFVLEKKGDMYLTEGYKGAPYGLTVKVPVEAGPFRGDLALDPIVVRQALHVDRTTAEATAVSDPLPQIHHGIPLRMREVVAVIDRAAFVQNPSDCSSKELTADLTSANGAKVSRSVPFGVSGCKALRFKPHLALRLRGRNQMRSGRHPAVRAAVSQTDGEAGIKRAEVHLPKTLALDPNNADALCEFVDGTAADPEARCPKGSIVGRAVAVSPLLSRPLRGNVFFVKNIRTDPETGNQIRTLPMIVAALRGEIAINLRGESSVKGRKLVTTFANVPDAPISQFNMVIRGGGNGILVVTETARGRINLCNGAQVAVSEMDAHNGRFHDRRIRMATPCRTGAVRRKRAPRANKVATSVSLHVARLARLT